MHLNSEGKIKQNEKTTDREKTLPNDVTNKG